MYKVIPNKKTLLKWKKHLPIEIEKVVQSSDIGALISRQIEILDDCYGADRELDRKRIFKSVKLPSSKSRRLRIRGYILEA